MRFLLDVNVGLRIAEALVSRGHDVERAALLYARAEDPELLARAVAGERILVTYDRDFSELVFARQTQAPPAIIYLRYRQRDVDAAVARLLTLDSTSLDGHMVLLDERHVRRTPFLTRSNDNG